MQNPNIAATLNSIRFEVGKSPQESYMPCGGITRWAIEAGSPYLFSTMNIYHLVRTPSLIYMGRSNFTLNPEENAKTTAYFPRWWETQRLRNVRNRTSIGMMPRRSIATRNCWHRFPNGSTLLSDGRYPGNHAVSYKNHFSNHGSKTVGTTILPSRIANLLWFWSHSAAQPYSSNI